MGTTKHTPGPYRQDGSDILSPSSDRLASVHPVMPDNVADLPAAGEEHKARIALFTAAPKLLEALEDAAHAIEILQRIMHGSPATAQQTPSYTTLLDIRAAIALAKGGRVTIHVEYELGIEELPAECIAACSAEGRVDDSVAYWRNRLGFTVNRENATSYLLGFGNWDAEELTALSDDDMAEKILWLACCDFDEWDGLAEDSSNGSDTIYLEG